MEKILPEHLPQQVARAIENLPIFGVGSAAFCRFVTKAAMSLGVMIYGAWTALMIMWLPSPMAILCLTLQVIACAFIAMNATAIQMMLGMKKSTGDVQMQAQASLIGSIILLGALPLTIQIAWLYLIALINERFMNGLERDERRHLVDRLRLNIEIYNLVVKKLEREGIRQDINGIRQTVLDHAFRLHQVLASKPLGTVTGYSAQPIGELWQDMQEWKFEMERRLGGIRLL